MDLVSNLNDGSQELVEFDLNELSILDGKTIQEVGHAMEVLTRVDLDLAYLYEKLGNLHILFTQALAWENDFETTDSEESFEKALVFDLLSGILDSEVKELDTFTYGLQEEIDNAGKNIYSCKHLTEIFSVMEKKLIDTEKSWKQSQDQVLDMKMLSAKLERASLTGEKTNWENDKDIDLLLDNDNNQNSPINTKLKLQTYEHQRYILRMAEKSLARELDIEKKFLESRENEDDLKVKLRHTEQVAFHMEEAAETAWERVLEAENANEVLMGTSKDLMSRLQVVQLNLIGSIKREAAVKSELQDCLEKLKNTESALQKNDDSELLSLREKVKLLENQLKESEKRVENKTSSTEKNQEKIGEMENIIEILKESISEAENRAENAENRVTELTETNLELTEEVNFLKASDSKAEKASLLENQVRELEIQLQHAKASSEANQEQQNMLYAAIWDMETLIEDLKSKVSKAENVEEKCVTLSELNFELNKEVKFMRVRIEGLEESLREVNDDKEANAEDINIKSKLIMDMIVRLAKERDRIHKELYSLREKKISSKCKSDDLGPSFSLHDSAQISSFSPSLQVGESSEYEPVTNTNTDITRTNPNRRMYILVAVLVVLISSLVAYMFHDD